MNFGLSQTELEAIRRVIAAHPAVREAVIFGSRALGRQNPRSDVDLALSGDLAPLEAESIALELEELPIPVQFDVRALDAIRHPGLRAHIARVGKAL
jgi:predicted nucleotidyltransferase